MDAPDLPMVPPDDAPRWVVPIDMPVWEDGKDQGRPVGWLTSNRSKTSNKWEGMKVTEARRLWRQAAWAQYRQHKLHRLCTGGHVGRIYMTFQWAFVNRRRPDLTNLPDTTKPIIDALLPDKTVMRKKETRFGEIEVPVRHLGIGMIGNDNDEWVVIGPQQPLLPYLGPKARIGGRVVVTIIPFTWPHQATKERSAA